MAPEDKEYLDARFAASDAKLETVKQYLDTRFNELRAELHRTVATTVKWCLGIVATGLLLYTTMLAFLMNNAVPRTLPAPPAAPTAAPMPAPIAAAPLASPPPAPFPAVPQPIVIVVPINPAR